MMRIASIAVPTAWLLLTASVCSAADLVPRSPRLQALQVALQHGEPRALGAFWERVLIEQSPLCEDAPDHPDDALYTFLWRAPDARIERGPSLIRTWPAPSGASDKFEHLANSDVWYLSEELPRVARFFYGIGLPRDAEGKPLAGLDYDGPIDPLRHQVLTQASDRPYPFVEGPAAPRSPYLEMRPGVPRGAITTLKMSSKILGSTRDVALYTPPGYERTSASNAFLLTFDGDAFTSTMPLPVILDNLIAERRIPPVVAAFVFTPVGVARNDDLSPSPAFEQFLSRELMPFIRAHYRLSSDPRRHVIVGSSLGGLMASYSGLCHPELFGNVISLSGSYWWAPDNRSGGLSADAGWLVKEFAQAPPHPLRVYMNVGTWEGPSMLLTTRILRAVMTGKGCNVIYAEFPGSHAWFNWRQALPDSIIAMLGPQARG
jgi:enterochelin esterase family protein